MGKLEDSRDNMQEIKNVSLLELARFTEECIVPVSEARNKGDVGDCYAIVVSGLVNELGVIQHKYELGLMVLNVEEAKWLDGWVATYSYLGMNINYMQMHPYKFRDEEGLKFLFDKSVEYVLHAPINTWFLLCNKEYHWSGSLPVSFSR